MRGLLLVLAASSLGVAVPAQERSYAQLLADMVDMDWLWRAPKSGERCIQFSSYNRRSHKGPDDHDAWYANWDQGHYLRVEERDGTREYVMVDAAGPACVVRMWSANPQGRLLFYVDGAKTPTWDVDFRALLTGGVAPFLAPLAAERAKGCNLYAPIPFARHLKITTTQKDCFYHVNVRYFGAGVSVPSFTPKLARRHAAQLAEVRQRLAAPGSAPRAERLAKSKTFDDLDRKFGSTFPKEVALQVPGPGVIRGLRVKVSPRRKTASRLVHRAVVLRIDRGKRNLVRAPVEDFFGAGPGFDAYAGYPMSVSGDGWGECRFPMPVAEPLRISLRIDDVLEVDSCAIECFLERRKLPPDHLEFHGVYHQQRGVATRPFRDYMVAGALGPGRYVGCTLSVFNPSKIWWGEGDEKIQVDGEAFPSTFGTGTEDYFGYAWCSTELFQSPFFNQVRCDGPRNSGYTVLNRFHIADQIPFLKTLRFDLEIWHWKPGIELDYASCAWWYAAPERWPVMRAMPAYSRRRPRPWVAPQTLRIAGALEGEALEVVARSGGETQVQDTTEYDGRWSGDSHLWWHGATEGDRLTFRLPVAKSGRYELRARFTTANDYGIVQVEVDGVAVGPTQDLYSPFVAVIAERSLGTVDLTGRAAKLALRIVGANPKAAPKHMVGLDYVRLVPAR